MTEINVFKAEPRVTRGTGGARATRREGRVPAVIYGDGKQPVAVSIEPRPLQLALHKTGFFARLFDLDLGGEKMRVLCRDVQFEPVTDMPVHADFMRVSASSRITVEVPVRFVNHEQSPGLKLGGVLNIVRHAIAVSCRADSIPAEILVDVAGSEIGTSFHFSNITLPEGVRPTIQRDFTIASIAAPTTAIVEEPVAAAAPAEGEEAAAAEGEGAEGEKAGEKGGEKGAEKAADKGGKSEKGGKAEK
jgi:large subunit ribosomal protein L25